MNEIGNKIYNLRKEKGLSQESFAEAVGVSRQTVYKWEAGIVIPAKEKLDKICSVLEVPKDYFSGSEVNAELAATTSAVINPTNKTLKILKVTSVLIAILLALITVITAVVGITVYPTNQGDMYEITADIENYVFYLFLCIDIAIFIGFIVLIAFIFKLKLKCKPSVN